jgi:hypothetical protein
MRRRLADRRIVLAAVFILGAVIASPLTVVAGHLFADVPNDNPFHADIDALADSGVTQGCGGPNYCPRDYVTREQMAAFMNRLGSLDGNADPVVNAATLDGLEKTAFMRGGDIVIRELGPWRLNGGGTLTETVAGTTIAGTSSLTTNVFLHLEIPARIGGQNYGLKSVEICRGGLTPTITNTSVIEGFPAGSNTIINDTTMRPGGSGCYTVTDPTPAAAVGGMSVSVSIFYPSASSAFLNGTSVTWTPVP